MWRGFEGIGTRRFSVFLLVIDFGVSLANPSLRTASVLVPRRVGSVIAQFLEELKGGAEQHYYLELNLADSTLARLGTVVGTAAANKGSRVRIHIL